jgi:hypothetical protein
MKSLKNWSLLVFIVAFFHASLIMGFFSKVPLIGNAVLVRLIEKNHNPLETIPFRAYMIVGGLLWDIKIGETIADAVYQPVLKEAVRNDKVAVLFDIYRVNIVVLVSLLSAIVFGSLARTQSKKQKKIPFS